MTVDGCGQVSGSGFRRWLFWVASVSIDPLADGYAAGPGQANRAGLPGKAAARATVGGKRRWR